MRALITGAGGFVGRHLCAFLLEHTDWDLIGTVWPHPVLSGDERPRLSLKYVDLRDPADVDSFLGDVQPDYVLHLAAQSFVPSSYADPWGTLENNIRAQLNILETVRKSGRDVRLLVVGSNEEYGAPRPHELPQTEDLPLRPQNPYAVSKVTQDLMGLQYHLAYGMSIVRVRPYNHTGPGQAPRFVVPAFASQIAAIEAGRQPPVMKVGNLEAARDFSDVRDIVRAYYLAVTQGQPGEVYNLASGKARSVQEVLQMLVSRATVTVRVERDPSRYRPVDVPAIWGSAERFRRRTGWEPEIPFDRTLEDTLSYWRQETSRDLDAQGGVND